MPDPRPETTDARTDSPIARRARVDHLIPAEKAIYDAVEVVEAAGAHPRLTDAVILLQQARDAVADFVDCGAACRCDGEFHENDCPNLRITHFIRELPAKTSPSPDTRSAEGASLAAENARLRDLLREHVAREGCTMECMMQPEGGCKCVTAPDSRTRTEYFVADNEGSQWNPTYASADRARSYAKSLNARIDPHYTDSAPFRPMVRTIIEAPLPEPAP